MHTKKNLFLLLLSFCTTIRMACVERLEVLNNFRAVMKGAHLVESTVDKLSVVTLPLVGDPNAKPPVLGEIAKQQQALNDNFNPIFSKLDVLKKVESDQPWLLEVACLEGGKAIVDDVRGIKDSLEKTLQTLKDNFEQIQKLSASPEIQAYKKVLNTSENIKKAMILVAEEHPMAQTFSKATGTIATQQAAAEQQPAHITYTRKLSVRNLQATPVTLKQVNITPNGQDMFGQPPQAVESNGGVSYLGISGNNTHVWPAATTAPIDLQFYYAPTHIMSAHIPAGEEEICIDVNEKEVVQIACNLQVAYTRQLMIINGGTTSVMVQQVGIPKGAPDMLNRPVPSSGPVLFGPISNEAVKIDSSTNKSEKLRGSMTLSKVSTGKIYLVFTFSGKPPLEAVEIPADTEPTCIIVDEKGAGKCPT